MRIIIVNDRDEEIGVKERDVLAKEDIYRVADLWITNSRGDVLLAQRKLTKKHSPGMWASAVTGTIEEGETYDTNIVKEAEEEIGLRNISPIKGPKRRIAGAHNFFDQYYTLVVDKLAEEFVVQESEVEQVKWFTRSELLNDLQEHPERYVEDVAWELDNL